MKPSKALISAAQQVITAMATVETVRPIVTAYQNEILAAGNFLYSEDFLQDGEKITTPSEAWKMQDEQYPLYDALLTEAAAKAGFTVAPGVCPLLKAENDLIKAERVLVEETAVFANQPNLTNWTKIELKNKIVELGLKFTAPYIKTK